MTWNYRIVKYHNGTGYGCTRSTTLRTARKSG